MLLTILQLMATIPGLRKMVTEPEDAAAMLAQATDAPSSSHHDDGRYDGKKREPQYANAQNSCLWEVVSTYPSPSPDRF